jgi:hypothetical protein
MFRNILLLTLLSLMLLGALLAGSNIPVTLGIGGLTALALRAVRGK